MKQQEQHLIIILCNDRKRKRWNITQKILCVFKSLLF